MRREFPVGPHDDGRLLRRDPVHHRRDPQARVPHRQVSGYMAGGGHPGTLSPSLWLTAVVSRLSSELNQRLGREMSLGAMEQLSGFNSRLCPTVKHLISWPQRLECSYRSAGWSSKNVSTAGRHNGFHSRETGRHW